MLFLLPPALIREHQRALYENTTCLVGFFNLGPFKHEVDVEV